MSPSPSRSRESENNQLLLPALMAGLPATSAWVSVVPPLLASVVLRMVLVVIVPEPALPTMLPLTPWVMPPALPASPIRLLLAVVIGRSMSLGVEPVPMKLPAMIEL